MATTQEHHPIAVSCALGKEVLLFHGMSGTEALSELSEYQVSLLSEKSDLKIDAVLATNLTVSIDLPQGGKRHFNGFVTRFALTGRQGRYATYQATIRPWLWFLTRSADCRIFQEKNVVDILKIVFDSYSLADFDTSCLTGEYPPLPYCVQYRETDFEFVSRLMAREGIYYYFKSQLGRHTLVLADSYAAHDDLPGNASLPFMPQHGESATRQDVINEWLLGGEIQSGSYALKAFDFQKPFADLLVKSSLPRHHPQAKHELFDYPGQFIDSRRGNAYAQNRIEAVHTQYERVEAATQARHFFPGALFALTGHPRTDQNKHYLIVSAHYVLAANTYESTDTEPLPALRCRFSALNKEHAYRPPYSARKPLVQGPQTAMVVGKAGEEIWTDKYGRIKVQFHWDRLATGDERSSCWVRVAQGWAGKHWGSAFIPRVGQEVIVSFLEGDPDQPLVTGSVYNTNTMPPYSLPENATRSTLKSHSSKGGGGYNELRFEDKKGKEQLFIHAAKDQDNRVENDSRESVGHNRHLSVEQSLFEQVHTDRHSQVGGDHNEKIGGTLSLQVGKNMQLKAAAEYGLDSGSDIHIKAGMNIVIEAGASITLKAGGGFIVIGPSSVTVSGTPILLNSGGSPGQGAGVSLSAPNAPMAADKGDK
ncbi:MAG: type VI secretion system tip protein VgrG [Pseudomonadota bacterium]